MTIAHCKLSICLALIHRFDSGSTCTELQSGHPPEMEREKKRERDTGRDRKRERGKERGINREREAETERLTERERQIQTDY